MVKDILKEQSDSIWLNTIDNKSWFGAHFAIAFLKKLNVKKKVTSHWVEKNEWVKKMEGLFLYKDSKNYKSWSPEQWKSTDHRNRYIGFSVAESGISVLQPWQIIEFLRIMVDSRDVTISLPQEKKLSIIQQSQLFLS